MNHYLLGSAIMPSVLLVWFFHRRDLYPEPARVLWTTFFLGVLTVIPVLAVVYPYSQYMELVEDPFLSGAVTAFAGAAIPEEFFKYLVVVFYCARHKEFDEPMDGIVYGVVASLGFATLENILYVSDGGYTVALLRALTAVPGHALTGAFVGYFIGQAKFGEGSSRRNWM
ncbi:MAG: PrsW family intramembrane metalloprotease, partial [Kofleriaceae bacterium]|nr:PrsW family intramembrane metalloprotease [Kofleriaceae bacterium]